MKKINCFDLLVYSQNQELCMFGTRTVMSQIVEDFLDFQESFSFWTVDIKCT